MTFLKPSTISSQSGAYSYKSGISSPSTNYIDNSFPSMLDKTGDIITGPITVSSTGSLAIDYGALLAMAGTLNVAGVENVTGTLNVTGTFTASNFPTFTTVQNRYITTGYLAAAGLDTGWTPLYYGYAAQTTGQLLYLPLITHTGSILTAVTISFIVANSHSGGVPATMPNFVVYQIGTDGTAKALGLTANQFISAPSTGADWYNGGTVQSFTYTCNNTAYNSIINSDYYYMLMLEDETGTNATSGNVYMTAKCHFTNITSQAWSV